MQGQLLSLSAQAELLARLDRPDDDVPPRTARQPVHTVYGGAHLFKGDTAQKLGRLALRSLDDHAADFVAFASALGALRPGDIPRDVPTFERLAEQSPDKARAALPHAFEAWVVHRKVREKLAREPVEDLRVDFEDGYGERPDDVEDRDAAAAAREMAGGLAAGSLPPFIGIRVKALSSSSRARALRTLSCFMGALLDATSGRLPRSFVVTLPKVRGPREPEALAEALRRIEEQTGLREGDIGIELMVETPQSLFTADGRLALPSLIEAAQGRCVALHFGTYDFTASVGVTASSQRHDHPICDLARGLMVLAAHGRPLFVSDGATTLMPTAPHRAQPGRELTEKQRDENDAAVHAAWRAHHTNVTRSLTQGLYQSWDLHPAQLPARYAAVFGYFLKTLDMSATRLKNFIERAAQASRVGAVFDDAATGQGLLNHFVRAMNVGAVSEGEVSAMLGVPADALSQRSFARLVKGG